MIRLFACVALLVAVSLHAYAQTAESFDILKFKVPAGWVKSAQQSGVQFGTEDANGGICLITVYKSTVGGPDPKANFTTAWEALVKDTVTPKSAPQMQPTSTENGWTIESGSAPYDNKGTQGVALLLTGTGGGKMVNVLVLTNSNSFESTITAFLQSIELPKVEPMKVAPPVVAPSSGGTVAGGFTTTNFDDGWTAVAKEDWVEVTKGAIKVLLHYPKAGTIIAADPEPHVQNAWNILVAPRYSNLRGFKVASPSLDYQRGYIGAGSVTDNQTKRDVFVSLFRKTAGWIEIITPDKNTFVQNFGFDIDNVRWDTDSAIWEPLSKLAGYNKFGVAASDLDGEWSDRFNSNTFYTNIYTGLSAGMSSYSSSESFTFSGGRNYRWHLVATNSAGGRTAFAQGKSAGTFKVTGPWQIYFSDIEGKPKTYNSYISYIKGNKVLWMIDAAAPGSGIYTGYAKK